LVRPVIPSQQVSLQDLDLLVELNFFFEQECQLSLYLAGEHLVGWAVATVALGDFRPQVEIVTR